jgi:hypothetical protein
MPVQAAVRTYCPEEVSAEKLRSTRQAQAKLTARGWFARDRATSTTSGIYFDSMPGAWPGPTSTNASTLEVGAPMTARSEWTRNQACLDAVSPWSLAGHVARARHAGAAAFFAEREPPASSRGYRRTATASARRHRG